MIGCLLSLLTMNFVNVNYDLTKYLPETAESAIGLDVMRDKFGYPGTARVMVKDVSLYEAKQYKDEIADIDGVDQVLWCDSTVNIYAGEDFIDESEIKDYYKDRNAVYDITFVEESDSTRTSTAIDEIKDLLGDKGCYVGMAVQNKSMTESMASEMSKILVVAVIMIFAVLSVTTTAWTEPILFLLVMGVAVLLNKGTNIFIGTVSFLTENVSIILQLATSMDYSIFLLDAFMNYRKQGMNEEDAIINAVQEAINSIFASSLTTVVGFLALVTMKFSIGFDLGLVLAKGIVFSLLTVVFFMPAMILKFAKLNEKTKHRSFMPDFHGLGKAIYRIRPIVFAVIVLVTPLAYTAQGLNDFLYGNDSMGASEGTQVYEDDQQITKIFGRSNMLLALYPNTSEVNERAMAKEIKDLSYVKNVTALADTLPEGIPEEFLPKSTVELLHKDGYCRMLIYTRTKTESAEAFKDSDAIQEIVKKYYPEGSYLVGETPSTQDIKSFIVKDYENVNVLSLGGRIPRRHDELQVGCHADPRHHSHRGGDLHQHGDAVFPGCRDGVHGLYHRQQYPAGCHGRLLDPACKQLPGEEKDAAEEKGMCGGRRSVLFLDFYFRIHHHAGRIYRVYDLVHNGHRGPGTPDRTRRTVQPCAGTDGASAAVNII